MIKNVFHFLIVTFICVLSSPLFSQGIFEEKESFTRQDTLRGSITKEREWWDLNYYHLDISVFPDEKLISGKNTVIYSVLKPYEVIQIDLQEPMMITSVTQENKSLKYNREGNVYFIFLSKEQKVGDINQLIIKGS